MAASGSAPRTLLSGPLAVGVAAVLVLGGGVVVVAAHEDGPPAAASPTPRASAVPLRSPVADPAQEQAYRDALRPVVEAVYDQVQALTAAEDQFDDDANGGFQAYLDTVQHPATGTELGAAHRLLLAPTAPSTLRSAGVDLDGTLTQFEVSARLYRESRGAGEDVGLQKLDDASGSLERSVRRWSAAVHDLYDDTPTPSLPTAPGESGMAPRRSVSHGAYLLGVGRVCGRLAPKVGKANKAVEAAGDAATVAAQLDQLARIQRAAVTGVLDVKAPPADRARLAREVVAPLRAFRQEAALLEDAAAGLRAGRTDALQRLQDEDPAIAAAGESAGAALKSYGSIACGELFTAGPEGTRT